jgi:hypothetical protein
LILGNHHDSSGKRLRAYDGTQLLNGTLRLDVRALLTDTQRPGEGMHQARAIYDRELVRIVSGTEAQQLSDEC